MRGDQEEVVRGINMKLQDILELETTYWQQRSRSNWIMFGERNTSYFHHHASSRHRGNRITKIQNQLGEFISKHLEITDVAVDFFSKLFTFEQHRVQHEELFRGVTFNLLKTRGT